MLKCIITSLNLSFVFLFLRTAIIDKTYVSVTQAGNGKKPRVIKFGLNHVTELVESKKAKLVVIAHDVDPIELVVWLPALCTKMGVPYCIVKGKARLGELVHQKTAACLALTDVNPADKDKLDQLVSNFAIQFTVSLKLYMYFASNNNRLKIFPLKSFRILLLSPSGAVVFWVSRRNTRSRKLPKLPLSKKLKVFPVRE